MNTAIINLRVDPQLKVDAQTVARKLGFNLSSILKGYLAELVKVKRVEFKVAEDPSPWLIRQLKRAEKELREGKTSPAFDNVEDAIKWLRGDHGNRVKKSIQKTVTSRPRYSKEEIGGKAAVV